MEVTRSQFLEYISKNFEKLTTPRVTRDRPLGANTPPVEYHSYYAAENLLLKAQVRFVNDSSVRLYFIYGDI